MVLVKQVLISPLSPYTAL